MTQQQKKVEEEAAALKSRPKKTHPVAKTQATTKPKSEVLRKSKLALTAAVSKGALNNVRSSSKEMVSFATESLLKWKDQCN